MTHRQRMQGQRNGRRRGQKGWTPTFRAAVVAKESLWRKVSKALHHGRDLRANK